MMYRLLRRGQEESASAEKPKFTGGDYRDLCYELETLINDVMHQRDLWKVRFFFHPIDADEDYLCERCNEGMRRTFYDNCDEFEALRWRPGQEKNPECGSRSCKYYCSRSIEDLDMIHPN